MNRDHYKGNKKLITVASPKIEKSNNISNEFYTAVMYLAPSKISGKNMCAHASRECARLCLNTAGRGKFDVVQNARINRTLFYINDKEGFKNQLISEIKGHINTAKNMNRQAVMRLNGTSDQLFERVYPELFTMFPDLIFYDYTKYPYKNRSIIPENLDLTFSRSETNHDQIFENLENGRRVAVVFNTKKSENLPAEYLGYPVVDGDIHDMRFLDSNYSIVGLRAKGLAKSQESNFVVNVHE